ncbi:hypothetical protein Pcinc_030418 [Petrolisthes cinctipes]|uniref:Uncharacterized protein n=1 Tax=Petrolisthes cinctipes TaxID=88211 RepID=A0AAE1EYU9_PETCI|nr:hypothetical protein Pcinc_030418 [Petrolisthes cinctipes]
MVTLLGDVHFWTLRDDVIVKDADVGAFRYQDKNTVSRERVYYEDKRRYLEARGVMVAPKNTRPVKLRDSLKELEELLGRERVVSEGWRCGGVYQLVFATGVLALLTINTATGDIVRVVFDRFLVGKLLSEHLADVVMTRQHLLLSYNECRVSVVHLGRMASEAAPLERLSALDPKMHTCEVAGPAGRRFERKLSANLPGDMVVVWWGRSEDEVYPWSPLARDRDRANVLVYCLRGSSLHLACYCRTEMAPLSVSFSNVHPNVLLTIEQGFGKKGGVTVLSCVYEVERGALHRVTVTTIPLEAPLMAHAHNPSEDRLLLACNNGVLALHCDARGMTHVTKAGLIPSKIAWLDSGNIVAVGNERGQVQCFDLALSLVRTQLVMEDPNPQRILDLSEHFCHQQSLAKLAWAPSREAGTPYLLLVRYTRGPLACLRMDVGRGGLSVGALVSQYVKHRQLDEAINLLVSLNWEQEGPAAMTSLTTVVNHLLRLPLTPARETQIEAALASFHVPVQPLSHSVEEEFGPAVRALTRRFFFRVLRSGRLEKALRIAVDLKDYDCFLAVQYVAKRRGDTQVAASALQSARDLESCASSDSCNSVLCGESDATSGESCTESCSTCFSDSASASDSDDQGRVEGEGEGESAKDTTGVSSPPPDLLSTHLAPELQHLSVSSSSNNNSNNSGGVSTVPPPVPPPPPSFTGGPNQRPQTHTAAITSQDGTVTINIRQPHRPNHSSSPGPKSGSSSAKSSSHQRAPEHSPRTAGRGTQRTVRDVFYSSDPNEEFVDSETMSVFVDRPELRRQYDQAVYQEVSTEEEDGGTVKVVHFGVV